MPELLDNIRKNHLRTKRFLVGTDRYGRDVLSQLILGTRVSLSVGLISVLISLVLGIVMGALAGYYGGKTDAFIMWIINVIWAVPTLLLVIAITFALGKGFWQVFIAVGLTMWVEVARVVRGQFISLKEKEFVEASKALGFNDNGSFSGMFCPTPLRRLLSFLLLILHRRFFWSRTKFSRNRSSASMPSWGSMIRENYGYIILDYAYLAIMPGIAIMLMVLAFMVAGNALRDALDVRTVE
jgi:peptide/nickel transport system permease protein